MTAIAYSYQRFSNSTQASGDSLRRQSELRDAFLDRRGLTLDTGLQFVDSGVSSFRGRNRDDNNDLGRFLGLVRDGRVPRGSYLNGGAGDGQSTDIALPGVVATDRRWIRARA